MARIGFTGSVSVGKTTLVKALSELPQFKDYHTAVERSKYLRDLGIPLNTDSTLKGQTIFLAERVSELFKENLITDRTIIDVMAFTLEAKSINAEDKADYLLYAKKFLKEYDYIFYVSPEGVEIEDNSVRETNSQYRDKIDFNIKNLCKTYKGMFTNYHEISGSTEERIKQILEIVNI